MKQYITEEIMKTKYGNWMPIEYGIAASALAGACLGADIVLRFNERGKDKTVLSHCAHAALLTGAAVSAAGAVYCFTANSKFSYNGDRQLARQVTEGIAKYIDLPNGGLALDVGCGSGALAIECAKRNPSATVLGVDTWGPQYLAYSKKVCERNAEAEGVANVRFEKGNALHLEYPDETFDAVMSNYVYHNIPSDDRQAILRETLRVLKKGGTFAIHDLMSEKRYGDMELFAQLLRDEGYERVELIDTTDGMFMDRKEAAMLLLKGSVLLTGTK